MFPKFPGWDSAFEQCIQLRISSILHLRDLQEDDDETEHTKGKENEPTLSTEVSFVSVEHVGHGEIEQPREEGVDEKADTLCFGSKLHRRGFGTDDRIDTAHPAAVEKGDDLHDDTNAPNLERQ